MKEKIVTISLALQLINAVVFSQDIKKYCNWYKPVVEDSSSRKSMDFDMKNNMYYTIENDSNALYIHILSSEPKTINGILLRGLTFQVRLNGNKKSEIKIVYPYKDSSEPVKMHNQNGNGQENKGFRLEKAAQNADLLSIYIKNKLDEPTIYDRRTKCGIEAVIGIYNEEQIDYRIRIPFKNLGMKYENIENSFMNIGFGISNNVIGHSGGYESRGLGEGSSGMHDRGESGGYDMRGEGGQGYREGSGGRGGMGSSGGRMSQGSNGHYDNNPEIWLKKLGFAKK
jgi:hypothetical protein